MNSSKCILRDDIPHFVKSLLTNILGISKNSFGWGIKDCGEIDDFFEFDQDNKPQYFFLKLYYRSLYDKKRKHYYRDRIENIVNRKILKQAKTISSNISENHRDKWEAWLAEQMLIQS